MPGPSPSPPELHPSSERMAAWASTMAGHGQGTVTLAHDDSRAALGEIAVIDREAREEREAAELAPGATRSRGAGNRATAEEPHPTRTCFERDRDRVLHDTAFRRLAGKTQVFLFPEDHQRSRLTHALEVAQVARSVAVAVRANVPLVEAIALGHDCGHGPGGHASEDALSPYLADGFDHAPWGADVALAGLNLCRETLDGIRNHSWSRPAPGTAEGEIVSWADRIAYVCHDFEDAVSTGVVTPTDLPTIVQERCGTTRREQLAAFIGGMIDAVERTGVVAMNASHAEALAAFRAFNYERIYLRPASRDQATRVIDVLRALTDHYLAHPERLPGERGSVDAGSDEAAFEAVRYVAGMTDRYAFRTAQQLFGWADEQIPRGLDSGH